MHFRYRADTLCMHFDWNVSAWKQLTNDGVFVAVYIPHTLLHCLHRWRVFSTAALPPFILFANALGALWREVRTRRGRRFAIPRPDQFHFRSSIHLCTADVDIFRFWTDWTRPTRQYFQLCCAGMQANAAVYYSNCSALLASRNRAPCNAVTALDALAAWKDRERKISSLPSVQARNNFCRTPWSFGFKGRINSRVG